MVKRIALLALVLVSFLLGTCDSAVIYGNVYKWDTLEIVKGAIVTIKDDKVQRMVSENGSYLFEVENGTYTIIAKWKDLIAVENVTVRGKTRYDIILFPCLEISEPPELFEENENPIVLYLITVAICSITIAFTALKIKRKKYREDLPEDLMKVLEAIRKEGGRITQRDLRKKLGYSEAKLSLILADLERRGLIEKVKKGRGNIVFLKEK